MSKSLGTFLLYAGLGIVGGAIGGSLMWFIRYRRGSGGDVSAGRMSASWIGFHLDGTLAHYNGWKGVDQIGAPIPPMVQRVREIIESGMDVKIVTARVSNPDQARDASPLQRLDRLPPRDECRSAIEDWCEQHIGSRLEVVCYKDHDMLLLYDDRAITVEKNTGRILTMRPEDEERP